MESPETGRPVEELPPETPVEAPAEPEAVETKSYEERLWDEITSLVERDDARAEERYPGLFGIKPLGKINQWFNRVGKRQFSGNLEEVGEWEQTPRARKALGIFAKITGGFGTATAMVMSGAGVLTAPIWTEATRTGFDGVIQLAEEVGWGMGRTNAELASQAALSETIEQAKERAISPEITEEEFADLLIELKLKENEVIDVQQVNMGKEFKWGKGRKIASGVLTLATGLFAGVPLGFKHAKEATQVGSVTMDAGHKVFWNWQGGHFLYNSDNEFLNVAKEAVKHGWDLTKESVYGQMGHALGRLPNPLEFYSLAGAFITWVAGSASFRRPKEQAEHAEDEESAWNPQVEPAEEEVSPLEEPQEEVVEVAAPVEPPPVAEIPPEEEPPIFRFGEPYPETSSAASTGAGAAPAAEPATDTERSGEAVAIPTEKLTALRQAILEKQGFWSFAERGRLQKEYEKIASQIFNDLVQRAGGFSTDGYLPVEACHKFYQILDIDPSMLNVTQPAGLLNKSGRLEVKIKWGLFK